MKMYVGITDTDWYNLLSSKQLSEVNFWKPGGSNFKALSPNEMFLFKLHSPYNYIVGGGFFVKYSIIPASMAWEAFGIGNGTSDYSELFNRIMKYRKHTGNNSQIPNIGCVILTDAFYFSKDEWINVPDNWSNNIVTGKTYSTEQTDGKMLFNEVVERLSKKNLTFSTEQGASPLPLSEYTLSLTKHRLHQGAFRVAVADAYQRRCAVTGEKTLPVLQAAHIKPVKEHGPYSISNGLFLRSDIHTLFDDGYITIDTDYRIEISNRLHEDYGNGKDYYQYHGQELIITPESQKDLPSRDFLEWHNENIYLG